MDSMTMDVDNSGEPGRDRNDDNLITTTSTTTGFISTIDNDNNSCDNNCCHDLHNNNLNIEEGIGIVRDSGCSVDACESEAEVCSPFSTDLSGNPVNDPPVFRYPLSSRPINRGSSSSSLSSLSKTSSLASISEEEVLNWIDKMDDGELNMVRPPCDCDECLFSGPDKGPDMPTKKLLKRQSSWRKIRSFILWSPFIQVFKKHRYPWIQLAGHQGNFQAGDAGSVLKKLDSREQKCFQNLMSDSLKEFVPEYRGNVEKNGDKYIQLQDLLCSFTQPSVMDIKMGVRTYLEEELHKARKSPTLRKDMYQKMCDVDNDAPTDEEHQQKAVTKPRYMQWRDEMSSSVELGFRVEGIKQGDGSSSKDFKKTKSRSSVVDVIRSYVGNRQNIVTKYIRRLKAIMQSQESSPFFTSHEVIGSSLLFVHDADENVSVWMIDFGKTESLPESVTIDHRKQWQEGNHEDGYLYGLDNLLSVLEEIEAEFSSSSV